MGRTGRTTVLDRLPDSELDFLVKNGLREVALGIEPPAPAQASTTPSDHPNGLIPLAPSSVHDGAFMRFLIAPAARTPSG
ncbi:hypothetical protein [Streptomyces sp. NPDC005969]|uniref:hypothetical protein n=1 Tax=Streptomyces sp. NPDC005969 TaxID=3156722 RepID=UPI00340E86BD